MDEVIRKELIGILGKAVEILEVKDEKDLEELKVLSDKAVEEVALHKDLDIISLTVLIYSVYKIVSGVSPQDYDKVIKGLRSAKESLERSNLGKYNVNVRSLFEIVRKCNVKVKVHLEDVMHAARIKKGAALLEKGLSIGQAAGLMGLSNWDLQQYVGRTTALEQHKEIMSGRTRIMSALKIFKI